MSSVCPRRSLKAVLFRSQNVPEREFTSRHLIDSVNLCSVQGDRLEQFREEVNRLLASPEFTSSRQLQDFLRFASEKALAGERHLDQSEIAEAVLGRTESFNPIEDSSVRKTASLARKRLQQYYQLT